MSHDLADLLMPAVLAPAMLVIAVLLSAVTVLAGWTWRATRDGRVNVPEDRIQIPEPGPALQPRPYLHAAATTRIAQVANLVDAAAPGHSGQEMTPAA